MRNVFMAKEDKPSIFQVSCHRLYPFVNGSIEVVFVDDVVLSRMLVFSRSAHSAPIHIIFNPSFCRVADSSHVKLHVLHA